MKSFVRYFVIMLGATLIGFLVAHFSVGTPDLLTPISTQLHLKVFVRGFNNVPVQGEIWLLTPEPMLIGHTDNQGNFDGVQSVTPGKNVVVEVRGDQFLLRKPIAVSTLTQQEALVLMSPEEAEHDNVSLYSQSLEELNRQMVAEEKREILAHIPPPSLSLAKGVERTPRALKLLEDWQKALTPHTPFFQAKGVDQIQLRLFPSEPVVELQALSEGGTLVVGGVLWDKTCTLESCLLQNAFWLQSFPPTGSPGQLMVSHPGQNLRAYGGHHALVKMWEREGWSQFAFPVPIGGGEERITLSVITPQGQIHRATVRQEDVKRSLKWRIGQAPLSKK